jgi:hypothetical protein
MKVRSASLKRQTRLGGEPSKRGDGMGADRDARGVTTGTGRADEDVALPFRIIRPRAAGSVAAWFLTPPYPQKPRFYFS